LAHAARPSASLELTDAELVCLAVAQVLLRDNDERHWLRAAPTRAMSPRTVASPGCQAPTAGHRVRPGQPQAHGEREAVRQLLTHRPINQPPAGSAVVTDKGLAGEGTEGFFAGLELALIRPARRDKADPGVFP